MTGLFFFPPCRILVLPVLINSCILSTNTSKNCRSKPCRAHRYRKKQYTMSLHSILLPPIHRFGCLVRMRIFFAVLLLLGALGQGCQQEPSRTARTEQTIVFKHGKIAGDPGSFQKLLRRFERENPGLLVKDETLPASTDEQHQFYVVNLESKSADFDVFALDVIWVPEFARAGWLRELTPLLAPGEHQEFFPGPILAVTLHKKMFAIPWYVDAGVLYYRKDLLEKYNRSVPETWQELVETAREVTRKEKKIYGYVWQGKQYEGLVCNVLEFIWSNGGDILTANGEPVINSAQNAAALSFMRDLIFRFGVTPPLVTTAIEEPTRQLFGSGRALFMRNWPYAWTIFNAAGSPVYGKVGVAELPSFPGRQKASTLGGWQLGINRYSRRPQAAEKLVRFLTSPSAQKELALGVGYKPARKTLYKDPDLLLEQPDLAVLFPVFMKARPRPVTPYYMLITSVLQPEFSAAISGIKEPAAALASAQKQVARIVEAGSEQP